METEKNDLFGKWKKEKLMEKVLFDAFFSTTFKALYMIVYAPNNEIRHKLIDEAKGFLDTFALMPANVKKKAEAEAEKELFKEEFNRENHK